jgi:hypothetical protein
MSNRRESKLVLKESDYQKLVQNLAMKKLGYNRAKRRRLLKEAVGDDLITIHFKDKLIQGDRKIETDAWKKIKNLNLPFANEKERKIINGKAVMVDKVVGGNMEKVPLKDENGNAVYGADGNAVMIEKRVGGKTIPMPAFQFSSRRSGEAKKYLNQIITMMLSIKHDQILEKGVKYVIPTVKVLEELLTAPVYMDKLFPAAILLYKFYEKDFTDKKLYSRLLTAIYANKNIQGAEGVFDVIFDPLVGASKSFKIGKAAIKTFNTGGVKALSNAISKEAIKNAIFSHYRHTLFAAGLRSASGAIDFMLALRKKINITDEAIPMADSSVFLKDGYLLLDQNKQNSYYKLGDDGKISVGGRNVGEPGSPAAQLENIANPIAILDPELRKSFIKQQELIARLRVNQQNSVRGVFDFYPAGSPGMQAQLKGTIYNFEALQSKTGSLFDKNGKPTKALTREQYFGLLNYGLIKVDPAGIVTVDFTESAWIKRIPAYE